jgi:hypothetical protein
MPRAVNEHHSGFVSEGVWLRVGGVHVGSPGQSASY